MNKIYLSVLLSFPFLFNAQSIEGTWKLAQQAGALGVGPNQGDINWWSNSLGDLTVRDCLFDDSITFDASGNMTHYMDGNTFLETWQGASAETCGTPVSPHDGGTFTYTFANNLLTINGTGGHIGLPKATNNGELSASNPPAVPSSITYEISFGSNGELIADINFGGGWWRFTYQKTNVAPPPPPPPPPANYDVILKVDASNITVGASGMYAGGGVLGDALAVQLADPDGDNIWEGIGSFPPSGGNYIFLNGPTHGGDWNTKEDLNGLPCADASHWNDRLMPPLSSDTTVCFEFKTCTPCGGTPPPPPTTYNVTFEVHTDSLEKDTIVSNDGIYIGGGFVGDHDELLLSQTVNSNGKVVWTGTIPLNANGGHFTILNGICDTYSCKEDISGQPCADSSHWNDRNNLLGGFSNDTTIVLEFGDCTRPISTTKVTEHSLKLSLYPNPTLGVINISSTSTITDYNIYNMIGNKVMSTNVNASNAVIDMSTLMKGVYFVEVNQNGTITNKRIIKK